MSVRPAAKKGQKMTAAQRLAKEVLKRMNRRVPLLAISAAERERLAMRELVGLIAARSDFSEDCAQLFEFWVQLSEDAGVAGEV